MSSRLISETQYDTGVVIRTEEKGNRYGTRAVFKNRVLNFALNDNPFEAGRAHGLLQGAWGSATVGNLLDEIQDAAEYDPKLSEGARRAKLRPANFDQLSADQQWDVDKLLGILDWDGT